MTDAPSGTPSPKTKHLMWTPKRKAKGSPEKDAMSIATIATRKGIPKPSAGQREVETRVEVSNGEARKTKIKPERSRTRRRQLKRRRPTSRHGQPLKNSSAM